jgi:hypothetical protein
MTNLLQNIPFAKTPPVSLCLTARQKITLPAVWLGGLWSFLNPEALWRGSGVILRLSMLQNRFVIYDARDGVLAFQ